MSITSIRFSRGPRKAIAGAAAALAVTGVLAGCGASSETTATSTNAAATTGAPPSSSPQGTPPGFGTAVTGAAAAKAKAAALAKYPGTVERVMKLDDGSYVVHVVRSSGGEVHVNVSKAFAVTGTEQGRPGGGAPPAGSAPSTGTGTATQS